MIYEVEGQTVTIISPEGRKMPLPVQKPESFEVYKASQIGIAKGDKVKITRNGFDKDNKRLNNGQSFEVVGVNKAGQIRLQNRVSKTTFTLDKHFGHISHAYCTTSHSSQGKTVDEVLISQPSATFTGTDAKQFYVSVSRGSEGATIYTDDRKALLEYASELGDRQSAMELVQRYKGHEATIHRLNHLQDKAEKQPESRNDRKQDIGYEP